ncbi:MAG: hypothetical protein ACI9XO_002963 [Paraglaciecola sp.]|jgi:hypothetical protein
MNFTKKKLQVKDISTTMAKKNNSTKDKNIFFTHNINFSHLFSTASDDKITKNYLLFFDNEFL